MGEKQRTHKIGYVGLGDMGQAMALNLAKRGWPLTVYDRRPERAELFTSLNVAVAASARETAAASDILCICVVDAPQVAAVLFGPDGAAASLRTDSVVVVHSTIGPDECRDLAARLAPSGVRFIDAAVTGAAERAGRGDLTLAVGGDAEVVARCMPLLDDEGSTVVHLGGTGSGVIAKLLNNGLFMVQVSFIDEVVRMGEAMGLDGWSVLKVIDSGAASSWASGYYRSQRERAGDRRDAAAVYAKEGSGDCYEDGALGIAKKDVRLFIERLQANGLGSQRIAQVAAGAFDSIGAPVVRDH